MVALITGATGGLGKAFSVECASRGWDLLITDRQLESLETLAKCIRRAYRVHVLTHACDLTDSAARTQLFRRVQSMGLRFTTLINVAGVDFEGHFLEQDLRQIETIIRLNVEGSLAMIHSVLHFRKPDAAFRVINVASMAAFYPMPIKATYAASKRFLLDFSLALREELAPLNATVTVLCPAGMPTNQSTIEAIYAQGLAGFLTTIDVGRVVNQTLNAAMAGKAVVIPGAINYVIQTVSALLPPSLIARLIHQRWTTVQTKRKVRGSILEKSYSPHL